MPLDAHCEKGVECMIAAAQQRLFTNCRNLVCIATATPWRKVTDCASVSFPAILRNPMHCRT
jgi:hypothetical protein